MSETAKNPSPLFWKGKRVFLTGHTGFKGGWLALWLRQLGAVTYGYSLRAPTEPNLFTVANVGESVDHHKTGDIRDLAQLSEAVLRFKPDIVIHMAAQPILRLSYDQPVDTYATNVMGTVNVLEATRRVGTARVILAVTTDKCYENREQDKPYIETDAMGGHDPYSSSKGCAELVVSAYGRSYFNDGETCIASVRAGNVIGGGDWAKDRLMTDIIAALHHNQSPVLRNPDAIRPWQHVLEPLNGYLLAVEQLWRRMLFVPECWNLGPEKESEVSVGALTESLCSLWGGGIKPTIVPDPRQLHEAKLLRLDSTKAKTELGWAPRLTLHEALHMIVDWHKAMADGADMHAVTLAQIASYQSNILSTPHEKLA